MYQFLALVAALLAWYAYRYYAKLAKFPPGPTPLPVIGNLLQIDFPRITESLEQLSIQYGGIFRLNVPQPMVIITDFQLIKEALIKNAEAFAGRLIQLPPRKIEGKNYGIISTDGPLWRDQRRFALHTLRNFGFGRNAMEAKILHSCGPLLSEFTMYSMSGKPLNPVSALQLCVGDIISDVLMGHTFEADVARFYQLKCLIESNMQLGASMRTRLLDVWSGLEHVPYINQLCNAVQIRENFRQLRKYFSQEIESHREKLNLDQEPEDYIEAYLQEWEARKQKADGSDEFFSENQLVGSLTDLWVAGMETSVTSLRWGLIYMTKNPEIQQKVRQEIHQVLGEHQQPAMADGQRLPYTSAVLLEMQRCANIVPLNLFHKTTQKVELAGYTIPAGTGIIPNIANVMWNPEIYPEPHEFRPERFLETIDGQIKVTNSEAVIPFSLGRRQCLGESLARMELFLIFVSIMQKFQLTPIPDEPLPQWQDYIPGITRSPITYRLFVESFTECQ